MSMWRWRTIRRANIPQDLRDEFERLGDQMVVGALVVPLDVPTSFLHDIRDKHRAEALARLQEQRDAQERRHDRLRRSKSVFCSL
jgi:hypothetical protein